MPTTPADSLQECIIALSIQDSDRQFKWHLQVDNSVVASNQVLSKADSQKVRDISLRHSQLFEQRSAPYLRAGEMAAIGIDLFKILLAPVWDKLLPLLPDGVPHILFIASGIPEILNLPWELVRPPDRDFLGFDPLFADSAISTAAALNPPLYGQAA